MRVFLAIRPPAEVLDHLANALAPVRDLTGRGLRWGDPGQWHLTLAFTPAASDSATEDLLADIGGRAREHAPLTLHLSGAGEFSGRTLWIGAGGDVGPLGTLLAEPWLRDDPEPRRRAHLTVARVSARSPEARRGRGGSRDRRGRGSLRDRRGRPDRSDPEFEGPPPVDVLLGRAVRMLSVYRGPTWHVDQLELVASTVGQGRSGGPLHEVLGTVPLGPTESSREP
jgi:2'-5' RNA ligase